MSENEKRMQPVLVLPPGTMSKKDMNRLRDNLFCVVESKDPSLVRCIEPPPMGWGAQERACISLCRVLFSAGNNWNLNKMEFTERFVKILLEGSPLMDRPITPVTPVKK